MEIGNIIPHIEALIFASDKPLTSMEITELINNAFGFMEEKLTLEQIQTSIDGIREKYASEFYPFEVRESGGGWQFLTKKDFHKTVAQLNGEKFLKRLSSAALETLAIVAYKQPITKGEIEAIRGVSSDYSIQKLLEKELIVISGRNEEMPGKPLVYSTSKTFMDYFGINSAADLPKLKEVFAETLVEPTVIPLNNEGLLPEEDATPIPGPEGFGEAPAHTPADSILHVSEQGELQEAETHGEPAGQQSQESDEQPDGDASTVEAALEEQASEEQTPEEQVPEEQALEEQTAEEQMPEEQAPEEIPPYADDDLAAEPQQGREAEGESDEEGDDQNDQNDQNDQSDQNEEEGEAQP